MPEILLKEGGLRLAGIQKADIAGQPLVSIVTVVLNGAKYLRQTIDSVLNQSYTNIEYIILDGGSTDGSLEIINEYADQLDYFRSEPDDGIYEAMNAGIGLCTGSLIGLKNADDWYTPTAVADVAKIWQKKAADIVYGDTYMVWQEEPLLTSLFTSDVKRLGKDGAIDHRTVFATKEVYQKYLYDPQYRICADYDWFLKLRKAKKFFVHAHTVVSYKRPGGVSASDKTTQEFLAITRKHFGPLHTYLVWLRLKVKNNSLEFTNAVLRTLLGVERFRKFKARKKK
jgi:glycosyltransferase involved in cell wall biosynthesis